MKGRGLKRKMGIKDNENIRGKDVNRGNRGTGIDIIPI